VENKILLPFSPGNIQEFKIIAQIMVDGKKSSGQ